METIVYKKIIEDEYGVYELVNFIGELEDDSYDKELGTQICILFTYENFIVGVELTWFRYFDEDSEDGEEYIYVYAPTGFFIDSIGFYRAFGIDTSNIYGVLFRDLQDVIKKINWCAV